MRLDVGPVARASAVAWIAWADEVFGELGHDPSTASLCPQLLFRAGGYLEQWRHPDHSVGGTFRWHANLDPDELEYLIHGLLRLDVRLAFELKDGGQSLAPCEGREFYLVLVRDLLHALGMEGPGRAAYVDQLRFCWPSAAEAS